MCFFIIAFVVVMVAFVVVMVAFVVVMVAFVVLMGAFVVVMVASGLKCSNLKNIDLVAVCFFIIGR